jgi:hypothetical protein
VCCGVRNQFLDVSYMNFVIQMVKSPVLVGGEIWTLPQMQEIHAIQNETVEVCCNWMCKLHF